MIRGEAFGIVGEFFFPFFCFPLNSNNNYNSYFKLWYYISHSSCLFAYYSSPHSWKFNSSSSRNGPGQRESHYLRWKTLISLFSYFLYLSEVNMCSQHVCLCTKDRSFVQNYRSFSYFLEVHIVKDIMILPPHFQLCTWAIIFQYL